MQGFPEPDVSRAPSLMAGFRPMGPTAPSSRMGGPSLLMTGPGSRMQGFGLPRGLSAEARRWHLLVDLAVAGAFIVIAALGHWSA